MHRIFLIVIICYSFEPSDETVLDSNYMRFTGHYLYSVIGNKIGKCWDEVIEDIQKECSGVLLRPDYRPIIWV